ncbi:flagellar biosynthesis protein FlhB [Sulfitobacter aestuarii]|uniref:Flagellar biosynthesis protein FlhB n=1 Tax=Sulfitobacter aestuarii TaxID=2161676 RepID=A0ABW5U1A2_9RHOB
MAEDKDDDGSRNEEATEKKLRKSREKGDVPVSKEVGHLLGYGALFIFTAWYLPRFAMEASGALGGVFALSGSLQIGSGSTGIADLSAALGDMVGRIAMVTLVALAIFLLGGLLSGLLQGPFVVARERIKPKGSKLSPLKGAKKLVSANNLVEFAKSFVKLVIIAGICLYVAWDTLDEMLPGAAMLPEWSPGLVGTRASAMLAWVMVAMIPVVLFDAFYKRFSHAKKQRMTLKEVKDEHKESEGDPQIKARREAIRRQRLRQQIRRNVPTATMILTNPTHFAVALRYERGVDEAPVCVAKGADLLAAQIRKLAHEHEIPVLESRELARALYAAAEVDRTIPEAHWPAVAQLVSFVHDLRQRIRRAPPGGARLRRPEEED